MRVGMKSHFKITISIKDKEKYNIMFIFIFPKKIYVNRRTDCN